MVRNLSFLFLHTERRYEAALPPLLWLLLYLTAESIHFSGKKYVYTSNLLAYQYCSILFYLQHQLYRPFVCVFFFFFYFPTQRCSNMCLLSSMFWTLMCKKVIPSAAGKEQHCNRPFSSLFNPDMWLTKVKDKQNDGSQEEK